jgi:hypothetical protein
MYADAWTAVVIGWAIFLAGIDTAFAHIGLDLNFLFYLMAVCTSGAVFPIGLLMCWSKLNKAGAVLGVVGGLVMGMVGWLVTAVTTQGAITITSLVESKVILAGSLSALGSGALISIILSLINPASFDFELTRAIGRGGIPSTSAVDASNKSVGSTEKEAQHSQAHVAPSDELKYEPALRAVEGGGRTSEAEAQYLQEVAQLEASQTRFRIITGLFLLVIRECSSSSPHTFSPSTRGSEADAKNSGAHPRAPRRDSSRLPQRPLHAAVRGSCHVRLRDFAADSLRKSPYVPPSPI